MSTPQNSVAPVVRTTSSPLLSGGKTSSIQLSEEVSGWVKDLSPSGASVYDTGWEAITVASGFTAGVGAAAPQVRRIGREVKFMGVITGPLTTTAATIGTVPAGFRPTDASNATGPTAHGNASVG